MKKTNLWFPAWIDLKNKMSKKTSEKQNQMCIFIQGTAMSILWLNGFVWYRKVVLQYYIHFVIPFTCHKQFAHLSLLRIRGCTHTFVVIATLVARQHCTWSPNIHPLMLAEHQAGLQQVPVAKSLACLTQNQTSFRGAWSTHWTNIIEILENYLVSLHKNGFIINLSNCNMWRLL